MKVTGKVFMYKREIKKRVFYPQSAGKRDLLDDFERVFYNVLSVNDVRDECSLSRSFDCDSDHFLVAFTVACQTTRHNLESFAEAELQRVEVFVVDEIDFLLTVFTVSFFEFSSFCHGCFS